MAIKYDDGKLDNLSLDHNWGDVDGQGQYSYSGDQVQHLVRSELKNRVGYFWSFSKNNIQNILIGFMNETDFTNWFDTYKNPDTDTISPDDIESALLDDLVLCHTEVAKGIPDPFCVAKLDNKYSSNRYISVDGKISIPVRFTSTRNEYDAATGELIVSDLGEQGTLIVQARQDSSISWDSPSGISKMTTNILPTSYNKLDTDEGALQYVNLTNFLSNGSWEVRMMVKNNTADGTESPWINYSVIKTVIEISLRTSWASAQTTGDIRLDFDYKGAYVDKYLNIEVTGVGSTTQGGEGKKVQVQPIGNNSEGVANVVLSVQSNDTYRVNAHGIHNIKYWVDIEKNENYQTEPKYAQIMVATDPTNLTPYIILNDVKGDSDSNRLTNWTNEDILSYAVYAPTAQGDLQTNFPIKLSFCDANGVEYFNDIQTINSKNGEIKSINKDLAIESDKDLIGMRLYCKSNFEGLSDNEQYNLLVEKPYMPLYVNNVGDYAPSQGADFIFNPRTRSNQEPIDTLKKVYNSATGESLGENAFDQSERVQWVGVNFNETDGWIQDSEGRKCLRLLDGQQLTIPYQPFSRKINGADSSAINCYTVEMTVATRNIVDNTVPLIRICDAYEVDGQAEESINGFELRGNDAYFIPNKERSRKVLDTYDILFQEGVKTHIALNICHGVKKTGQVVTGDISKQPGESPHSVTLTKNYNFIRIYVNGVLNRVAEYEGDDPMSDELQSVGSGTGALKRYIVFGNTGVMDENGVKKAAADLDIYEMRVYKGSYEKPEKDILKDYIASLSSIDEKQKMMKLNDILDKTTGRISYNKASLMYNTLVWKPCSSLKSIGGMYSGSEDVFGGYVRPCGQEFGDTKKTSNTYNIGDLEVRLFKKDSQGNRVLDEAKSGTLTEMFAEGQGTSAMSYWKWNQRFKFAELDGLSSNFIPFNSSYETIEEGYRLNDNDPVIARLDGKINWASSMQSHKMGTTALYNDCQKEVVGGHSMNFLNNADAFAKIDLGKTGSEKLTPAEAFTAACGFTGRNDGYGSCRTCIRQEAFLFFVQPGYKKEAYTELKTQYDTDIAAINANTSLDEKTKAQQLAEKETTFKNTLPSILVDPIYYGPLTWGASKGDKPTFGYNKKFNPYFVMIEGTDNDRELIMCRVPWDDTHVVQPFEAEKEGDAEEDWVVDGGCYYGAAEQFEISMGKDSKEYIGEYWSGENPCLAMFKEMINFAYLHNPHINVFDGTYDELKKAEELKTTEFYWVTKSSSSIPDMGATVSTEYDLYRYNSHPEDGNPAWVPAGFYDKDSNTYAALNLKVQLQLKDSELQGTLEENNTTFKNARVARFKEGYKGFSSHPYNYHTEYPNGIGEYVNIEDLKFTLQFLKLVAGTDNWGKNTYFYNSGIYYKKGEDGKYLGGSEKFEGLEKFGFFQDDMDTIFEIDNSGQKTKPYYVEEHDIESNDGTAVDYYWNSQSNALFCLAEQSYSNEMKDTMASILSAMQKLGGDPQTCFDKYYQIKTAEAYPAEVFNQNSNLLYMDGHYRSSASGTRALFLSQCLGDQVQAERDWQDKRVKYMSSYARWGEFNPGTSSSGGLIMRSKGYAFTFELTPYIWLYPAITHGSSDIYYLNGDKNPSGTIGRVKAGETIVLKTPADSETQVNLKSINSYRNIGNFARHTADTQFTLQGERITDFIVKGTADNPILFNPSASFKIDATANIDNLRNFEISGRVAGNASILNYALDLQRLWRLETLDVTATSTTGVTIPDNSNIQTIKLPGTVRDLKLVGQSKLSTFELSNYSNLKTIEISDTPYIKTLEFVSKCMSVGAKVNSLTLLDVNWEEVDLNTINYILSIPNTNMTGVIKMKNTEELLFSDKSNLLNRFGNIDDVSNPLRIIYTVSGFNPNVAKVVGDTYISKSGRYQYTLTARGNDFIGVDWTVTSNEHATIDNAGLLTFNDKGSGTREVVVTCNITRTSGVVNSISKTIYFKEKDAEVGDYVYYDGTLSSPEDYNPRKSVVGVCYYVNGSDRRMMAVNLASSKATMWGLSANTFADTYTNNPLSFAISPSTIGLGNLNSVSGKDDVTSGHIESKALTKDLTTEAFSDRGQRAGLKQYPKDTVLPCGQFNTINIIEHRNELVVKKGLGSSVVPGQDDSMNYTKPEKQHLDELVSGFQLLSKLIEEASLYPAASYCYAYEPTVKQDEVLDSKFVKHNWYLPSMSELLYMWKCSCPDMIGTSINPVGLGKCKVLQDAGVWVEPTGWGYSEGPTYWSSNQSNVSNVYTGQFRTNNFRIPSINTDATTGTGTNGVISRYYVRACSKF